MKKGIIKSGLLKMTACTVLSAAMVLGSAWVPGFNTGSSENQTVAKVYTNSDIVAKADVTLKYSVTGSTKTLAADETPFGIHGKLGMAKVSTYGNALTIVDKDGYPYQLHGASTHGLGFDVGYTFVNKSAFQSVRDEFGVNTIRLAAYPRQYGGYTTSTQAAAAMDTYIQNGVKYATELGMYVIVDWHVHEYNPNETKTEALEFFRKYATMYKDYDNVIFEICNEPTGTNWYNNGAGNDIYTYADSVIRLIRSCGSDALIICGTNTWSQDVEDVAKKPINDNRTLYAFHYYSGTHGESYMTKVENAINAGTPIYISEYGICAASGNGGYDTNMADKWMALCDKYNLSLNCWSLSNKAESASYFNPGSSTTGGWTASDLTTTGKWLVNTYRDREAEDIKGNTSWKTVNAAATVTPLPSRAADPTLSPTPTIDPANLTNETAGSYTLETQSTGTRIYYINNVSSFDYYIINITGTSGSKLEGCVGYSQNGNWVQQAYSGTSNSTGYTIEGEVPDGISEIQLQIWTPSDAKPEIKLYNAGSSAGGTTSTPKPEGTTSTPEPEGTTSTPKPEETTTPVPSGDKTETEATYTLSGGNGETLIYTAAVEGYESYKVTIKGNSSDNMTGCVGYDLNGTWNEQKFSSSSYSNGYEITGEIPSGVKEIQIQIWWPTNGGAAVDSIKLYKTAEVTTTPEPEVTETPGEVTTTPEPEVTETPGEVTTTPQPEVTETPVDEDNIQKFVRRMYKVCFDREPDEAGFEGWCNGLKNGTENYRSIALGFLTGEEMTVRNLSDEEYVTEVYKALFDREPDEGGYNGWLNALKNGMTRAELVEGFIVCDEYSNICDEYEIESRKDQIADYVERLYTVILGRASEEPGKTTWTNTLFGNAISAADAAYEFAFTPEFVNQNVSDEEFVTRFYQALLDREPDDGGLETWTNALKSGVSRKFVLEGFMESVEFTDLCNKYAVTKGSFTSDEARDENLALTGYINRVYQNAVGTSADADTLNTYASNVLSGETPKSVAYSLYLENQAAREMSNEDYVAALYRGLFGREPDAGASNFVACLNAEVMTREDAFNELTASQEYANVVAAMGLAK